MISIFNSSGYAGVMLLCSGLFMLIVDRRNYKSGKSKKEYRFSIVFGILLIVMSIFTLLEYFAVF